MQHYVHYIKKKLQIESKENKRFLYSNSFINTINTKALCLSSQFINKSVMI